MIEVINGDILKGDENIILQQVNCSAKMGRGLAKSIMDKYPTVRPRYIKYCKEEYEKGFSPKDLLGRVLLLNVEPNKKYIANIFGQVDVRKGENDQEVYTEKEALLEGIRKIKEKAEYANASIAIPTYIGCGLGNGNWEDIKSEIEKIFIDTKIKVRFYHYR